MTACKLHTQIKKSSARRGCSFYNGYTYLIENIKLASMHFKINHLVASLPCMLDSDLSIVLSH